MLSIGDYVKGFIVARRLRGEDLHVRHPRMIMEQTSGNSLGNIFVREVFSDMINPKLGEMLEGKNIPIDTVLGSYSPSLREIIIYTKAIERMADHLNLDVTHVEFIVRLHEFAHAVFHGGFEGTYPIGDVDRFVSLRTQDLNKHLEPVHEWVAQHLTYSALCHESCELEKGTSIEMMNHQPDIYRINPSEIECQTDDVINRSQLWIPTLQAIRDGFNPLNLNRV